MDLTLAGIIAIILVGMALLLIELLILPGLIMGTAGFALITGAIWAAYAWYGNRTGTALLFGTIAANILMIVWALRSKSWKGMQLSHTLHHPPENAPAFHIKAGDTGLTISRLAPSGKARINGHFVEVHSDEGFVDQQTEITVHSIAHGKIIVRIKA